MKNVVDDITEKPFYFPLYVDITSTMQSQRIPDNPVFSTFLLNKDGYPVFVGNPLRSEELMQVFLQSL